jgi:hypothetical protein
MQRITHKDTHTGRSVDLLVDLGSAYQCIERGRVEMTLYYAYGRPQYGKRLAIGTFGQSIVLTDPCDHIVVYQIYGDSDDPTLIYVDGPVYREHEPDRFGSIMAAWAADDLDSLASRGPTPTDDKDLRS